MTTHPEYLKIDWSEVKAGETVLMHENGDRNKVVGVSHSGVQTSVATLSWQAWGGLGFTPHRPVPPLDAVPTEPGAYHDKDGLLWAFHEVSEGGVAAWGRQPDKGYFEWLRADEMRHRAPFTRLVSMPTEEQVLNALRDATLRLGVDDRWVKNQTTAVMALLTPEERS